MKKHTLLPEDLFVTGTDTDVGKTTVSLLLLRAWREYGHEARYFKPVQTGCAHPDDAMGDAHFIHSHNPQCTQTSHTSTGLCFTAPKAPLYAARDQKHTIELKTLLHRLACLRQPHSPLVVEGSGGLMVPLNEQNTMADFIKATGMRTILIARTGLGTINHTLLSLEALKVRNVNVAGILFVETERIPPAQSMVQENMEAIATFSGTRVSGVIPYIADFQTPPAQAQYTVQQILEAL